MLITIYDSTGTPKAELSPNDSSTHVKEIQGDSVLTLSFTHYDHIELDVDDYVDFEGERFWLTEKYRPRQNARKEWVYDIKLYGVESMLKRLLVIKSVDGEDDPVFTLTATPREHVAMIVRCMNNGLGNITDWKVGQVVGTENVVIDYFGKYCDEALKEIAEKVGAEAWVEGQTVNICKCERGEPIAMGYDKGLLSIDPGTADNVKFYTRLYPVGSSRNIDREKYGYSRLQLPGNQKYVEINADKYGRVDHYEQDAFADIYPRRIGIVSNVRSEVKTGEDGNPFTIYYFSDNSLPFDPNAYEIGGLVKRVSFQEGSELAGLGEEDNGTYYFEVNFNSTTREFEIITIWPYDNDMQLPGDKLVPKAGDKYILWNIGMPDEYYTLAEAEFLAAAEEYNADHNLDITVYKAPTDHVWIEDNEVLLTIGQRIRLESEEYFPETGYRDSRITRITRKVNLPSSMDIEISDALSRTAQEKMSDSINDVRSYARSIGEGVNLPDIIGTGDKTRPTDKNLLSARRTYNDLLHKNRADRTKYMLASDEGFDVGDFLAGVSGARLGRDAETGKTFAEVDYLYARVKAYFESLTIIEANSLAGKQYITPGGGIRCVKVEEVKDGNGNVTAYRCYFLSEQEGEKTETKIIVGDQAISEMFNAKEGTANKFSNHRYWRLVTAVSNDAYTDDNGNHYGYIELSKTDCEAGSDEPKEGDVIDQLGNRDDATRQAAMVFSTVDEDAPSIKLFTGIGSGTTNAEHYSLSGRDIISYGYNPVRGNAYFKCYGDLYVGARDASSFVEFNEETNEVQLHNVTLSVGSKVGGRTLGSFMDELDGSKYLRDALPQSTTIANGLVLTSAVLLGYENESGERATMAGHSGLYTNPKSIASFWGGPMVDRFYDEDGELRTTTLASGYAASLFRMDGSAYSANGNIGWDNDGSGWLGDKSTGNAITFANGSMTFGSGIKINVNNEDKGLKETLESLMNFNTGLTGLLTPCGANDNPIPWSEAIKSDGVGGIKAKSLKSSVGLWSESFVSARGKNSKESVGGATQLRMLTDISVPANPGDGQVLAYDSGQGKWVNRTISTGLDTTQLASYLTNNNYAKLTDIPNLGDYLKKTEAASLYQPKGNYLTGITKALVEEALTGDITSHTHSQYLTSVSWGDVSGKPAWIGASKPSYDFSELGSRPTTLAGYGITDAKIANGVITLGGNTITPVTDISGKVDKVDGKGLSTNDFTDTLLAKLNGIAAGANKYVHPSHTVRNIAAAAGLVLSSVAVDAEGHVTDIASKQLTAADIPTLAISKVSGLQSALDSKLNATTFNEFKAKIEDYFEFLNENGVKSIKANYGFWTPEYVSARGKNPYQNQGIIGATELSGLGDVLIGNNLASGQALVYNGTKWVNQTIQQGLDTTQLASYLTANNYAKLTDIPNLGDYLKKTEAASLYQPKGSYLTGITKALVEEALTGDITSHTHSQYLTSVSWGDVSSKPAWIGAIKPGYDFSEIGAKPTTISGYGITDARIDGSVITLGNDTITPLVLTDVKSLTFQSGAFSGKTYTPTSAQTVNIPTTTSHITEGTRLYFTVARAQDALSGHTGDTDIHITATERTAWNAKLDKAVYDTFKSGYDLWKSGIDTWKSAIDAFRSKFEAMFDKDGTGEDWSIKALRGLWSPDFISARGKNPNESDRPAGIDEAGLAQYLTNNNYAKKSDIPSLAGYAKLTDIPSLGDYLKKTEAASLYQTKGNYLTGITKAQVEEALTGDITSHTHSQYLTSVSWGDVSSKPAWIGASKPSYDFSELGSRPTTLAGYGIMDAKIANGVITLGGNTITPIVDHQDIFGLTFAAGDFSARTYSPNSAAQTVNIPTTTSHITEGTRLYFTDERAQDALSGHTGDTDIHITASERTAWNAKLDKSAYDTWKDAIDTFVTKFNSMFAKEPDGTGGYRIKALYGLYADAFISARGLNPFANSGPIGASNLGELDDVILSSPSSGQVLTYNGTRWVNQSITVPSLSGYATQSWVQNQGYVSHTEADELRRRVYGFELMQGTAAAQGYDLDTLLQSGGMTSQYGNTDRWKNAPSGMRYGSAICFKAYGFDTLMGMLAWDVSHAQAEGKLTGALWWRAYANKADSTKGWGQWEQVAFTSSNVASATKLATARTLTIGLAGKQFDGTSNVSWSLAEIGAVAKSGDTMTGLLTLNAGAKVPSGQKLTIGDCEISWDSTKGMLKFSKGIYSEEAVSARGANSAGGGTGNFGLVRSWPTTAPANTTTDALGANLGYELHTKVTALEGKNYLNDLGISVTGSGNAVTAVSQSADKKTLTFTKGSTFLTSITKSKVEAVLTGDITSHTHSQYLASITKAQVENVLTGNISTHTHSQYLSKWGDDGVLEVARYIDFHTISNGTVGTEDYTVRFDAGAAATSRVLTLPASAGTLATQEWVTGKNYLTSHQSLANYVTKGSLNFNDINDSVNVAIDAGTVVRRTIITRQKSNQGFRSRVALGLTNPANSFSPAIISVGLNDGGTSWKDFYFNPDGTFEAGAIKRTGGTSSQFLKADGSVDTNSYLTTGSASSTYLTISSYTAADVLSKLLTVDGPSSGLNADLLDGQHASAFLGVSDTAVSATKLETSRKIWGQDFDGTEDVNGDFSLGGKNSNLKIYDGTSFLAIQTYNAKPLCLNPGGCKVGVGTNAPAYTFDVSGSLAADTLTIKGTDNKAHLAFSRDGYNNITAPASGVFAFVTNGKTVSEANSDLVIEQNVVRPGKTNVVNLGTSTKRWTEIHAATGWFFSGATLNTSTPTSASLIGSGRLELYHATPFIDFHFGNSTADYTTRIIEEASGKLKVIGELHTTVGAYSDGYISARGQNSSDVRLKTDIRDFKATDIIMRLRPKAFRWNALARSKFKVFDTDEIQYGLIAQDVKETDPWLVDEDMFHDGLWGVHYEKTIPVMLQCAREHTIRIEDLDARVKALEHKNSRLELENRELKQRIAILERR